MSDGLASGHCVPCEGGIPPITEPEAQALLAQLTGSWHVDDNHLRRELKFANFSEAFAFATRVALIAEAEGHHPDLTIGWGRVQVDLTTHAARGLTRNDFVIAAKIDAIAP